MVDGARRDTMGSEEEEAAIADEFRAWVESWRGNLSVREVAADACHVGRAPLTQALDASITGRRPWSRAHNGARSRWLANRERWLTMTLEELEAERDERDEREARAKAADALGAEAEVHDDDAPYATANDERLLAVSGVSDENIEAGSTPLAGKPRKVEQGGEPDASQPDAELSDDAKPSIMPSDAPDATALTPVAPADVRLTPASVQSPVNAPVTFDDPPAALGDASAGAPVAGAPTGEAEAGVPAPGAYNENAPTEGDAAATDDADGADWGENAAVCVTEGATEEVRLSLSGGPPPVGLDLEDMIALIGARNAERCGQEAFSIEFRCRVSDTAAPRSPSGAMSV